MTAGIETEITTLSEAIDVIGCRLKAHPGEAALLGEALGTCANALANLRALASTGRVPMVGGVAGIQVGELRTLLRAVSEYAPAVALVGNACRFVVAPGDSVVVVGPEKTKPVTVKVLHAWADGVDVEGADGVFHYDWQSVRLPAQR